MKKLILFLVVFGFGQSHAASMQEDQSFTYKLEMSRNDKVCRHMQKVYNKNFRQPWKTEPLDFEKKTYGENSEYAFPRLPGVEHNDRFTFLMRYSKLPTSPEFEAIKWREGRRISPPVLSEADCKQENNRDSVLCKSQESPFLVAEFDINNDGRDEQVVKTSFMSDWAYGNTPIDGLQILKKKKIDFSRQLPPSMKFGHIPLTHRGKGGELEIIDSWRHIRPFVLFGKTYLYFQDDISRELNNSNLERLRSYTIVSEYHNDDIGWGGGLGGTGSRYDFIKDDLPGIKQICRFRMIPIK